MTTNSQFDRRTFLRGALATTAACGLARLTDADDAHPPTSAGPIIDTHVYLGHWPHDQLPGDQPSELLAILRNNQVSQAWTGAFDGMFHKDIGAVNQRLADTCTRHGDGFLIPFGAVNPTLPDWEEDLRRCHETFHMPGIRLHPNYHSYTLDDPRFARLLELAAARGLTVQLVAWMEDQPHKWLSPHAAQVDLKPLARVIAKIPNVKLIIANGFRSVDDVAFRILSPLKQVRFDFARLNDANELSKLVSQVTADRVVFGSCAPLHRFESTRSKMQDAKLSDDQRKAIASETATRLISDRPKTGEIQRRDAYYATISTR